VRVDMPIVVPGSKPMRFRRWRTGIVNSLALLEDVSCERATKLYSVDSSSSSLAL